MHGLVVKNTGFWCMVLPDGNTMHNDLLALDATQQPAEGGLIPCKVKGNFRLKGIRTTSPVAVGDGVTYETNREGFAFITDIDTRRNYIIRRASNLSKQAHILASNIDQVLLLVTVAHPETSTTFIDRFLATAEAYNVPCTIVIGKADLHTADERAYAEGLALLYRHIGYPVVIASPRTGLGMDQLREVLTGRTTLLSGHSGVGKSTLVNTLIPDVSVRTARISDVHDTGMHTTTFSEMYRLPIVTSSPAYLIDTPGIKGFGTIEFERESVGHYFREIFATSACCRFGNCTHTHEPGCAVIQAVEDHKIAPSRYHSYLSILDDEHEGKYREAW